jgi:hypothetical protein
MSNSQTYELRPIKLGCEVYGIDLKSPISDETKQVKLQSQF